MDNPSERDLAIADELGQQMIRFARMLGRAKAHFGATQDHNIERAGYALLGRLIDGGPQRTTALAETVCHA
mgnify:CR=1 FL=1